jgi:pimeloyl-ACP methyl ester carboxylesterase
MRVLMLRSLAGVLLFLRFINLCQGQTATATSQLFYEDTTASQRVINQLAVDNAGNVISFTLQTSGGCGFGICGAVVYSVAPNGSVNWITSDTHFIANTVNEIALDSDNNIFFQDFFSLGKIQGVSSSGSVLPNWPVSVNTALDTFFPSLLIDPVDQSVLAKGGSASAFEPPSTRTASFRQDGSAKWTTDLAGGGDNTAGMVIGPNNNIYTFSDHTVLLDRNDGHTICEFPSAGGDSFSPITGGDGLVFSYTNTGVQRSDSGCIAFPIYSWDTGRRGQLLGYDNGVVFGFDLPLNGTPGTPRFIAISKDGALLWHNDSINPLSIAGTNQGLVYVVGIDVNIQCCSDQKLFVLDETTGNLVSSVDITAICPACVKVAVGSSGVYVGDLSSTRIYKLNGVGNAGPATPTGISAIVGIGSVYLRWDTPEIPVDQYFINFSSSSGDQGQITYIPDTTSSLAGIRQNTAVIITKLPNGSAIQNGVKYQFNIVAETGGILSLPSTTVSVIPNSWDVAGHLPPRPLNPILFLHGFTGVGTFSGSGTFAQTFDFMVRSLGWRYGGQLYHQNSDSTTQVSVDRTGQCTSPPNLTVGQFIVPCNDDGTITANSDFVSASFGSNTADYSDSRGLDHQADEVKGFIDAVISTSAASSVTIVGHSDGGLGARDYLTNGEGSDKHVDSFITYGTPHQGADLSKVVDLFVGHVSGSVGVLLFDGARDSAFFCSGSTPLYYGSPVSATGFLGMLNDPGRVFPEGIRYTSIVGISDPNGRPQDCHSSAWDGLVPRSSADLSTAPPIKTAGTAVSVLLTGHAHHGQGNDFSPVGVQVVAPDGNVLSEQFSAIPGASYSRIKDTQSHETTSVLIPFPTGGKYTIIPIPNPGVSPTDTFTITLTQNGLTTVVAGDVQIKNIPPSGYQTDVNAFPIAVAGPDQTVECTGPGGAEVMLDGSASTDPDRDVLTYEWRDDNGNLVGAQSIVTVTVPLGTHRFVLTVRDGRGGFNSSRVAVAVKDTTPPTLDFNLSPSLLWPPNHTLTPVTATVSIHDTCDIAPRIKLISITSSEPPLGLGSDQISPDITGASLGTDDRSFLLRAERSGDGPGRTYTVTYEAEDRSGNKTTKTGTVVVPHNK